MAPMKADASWIPEFRTKYAVWLPQAKPFMEEGKFADAFKTYPFPRLGTPPWAAVRKPLSQSRVAFVSTGGLKLHYLDWGTRGKRPLLLLHGGMQTAHSWDLTAVAMRRDRHVVAMDLRGHGDSDWSDDGDYSYATHGADIEKIVLGSYRFANEQGKAKVDLEALRAAVDDFIPSASMADIDGMTVAGLLECSSRRLLPPHVKEILVGIATRGLVPNLDEVFGQLRARNILPAGLEPKVVAVLPPNNENN
jgi:hypothetical protein